VAGFALYQGISETIDVSACLPDFWMHHDARLQTNHIVSLLNYSLPPSILNVSLKLHSKGSIIPAASQTTIDLATGKNKAPSLAQRDNLLHTHVAAHFTPELCSLPILLTSVKGGNLCYEG